MSEENKALLNAIEKGDLAQARVCVEMGADVNAHDDLNRPFLHRAVLTGRREMVGFLLEHKADVHDVCPAFFSPLHIAIQERCFNIADMLIAHGANVDFQRNPGYSNAPLHIAIYADDKTEGFERIEYLLGKGASADVLLTRNDVAYAAGDYARNAATCKRGEAMGGFIDAWAERQAEIEKKRTLLKKVTMQSRGKFAL